MVFLLIVGGVFTYLYTGANLFGKVKNSVVQIEMKSIDRALLGYYFNWNKYPRDLKKFLAKEMTKSAGQVGFDPWGVEYVYEKRGKKGYQLISAGLNKTFGDEDDVILTRKGREMEIITQKSHIKPTVVIRSDNEKPDGKDDKIDEKALMASFKKHTDFGALIYDHLEKDIADELAAYITNIAKEEGIE